jgi:hypothetical protein
VNASPDETRAARVSRTIGQALAVPVAIGVLALVGAALVSVIPKRPPHFKDPSFVEVIFANRAVVTASRLAVLFAAAYIVISVVALIQRGQWLSSVGPIKTSEAVRQTVRDRDQLAQDLESAREVIEDLQDQLTSTTSDLVEALEELERHDR